LSQTTFTGEQIPINKEDDTPKEMTEYETIIYNYVIQRFKSPPTTIEIEDALRYRKPRIEEIGNKLRSLRQKNRLRSYKDRSKDRLVWIKKETRR